MDGKVEELLRWLRAHDALVGPISAGEFEGGLRGVAATADIQPDQVGLRYLAAVHLPPVHARDAGSCLQVLLEVPERLLMSTRSARRNPVMAAVLNKHAGLTDQQVGHATVCRTRSTLA